MIKAGLTGGIGSGKSTVARIWESLGAYYVNADALAKEIMTTDDQVKKAITDTFGAESYLENGELNRPWLAQKAFQGGRVEELNKIVHPAVYRETALKMDEAEKSGAKVFVKEAALLLKNGRPDEFDVIVLVDADPEIRISRVMQRDGSDRQSVEDRIRKQDDFSKKTHLCDYIITNNKGEKELKKQAEDLYKELDKG